MQYKQYADNTKDTYTYNSDNQLTDETDYTSTGATFATTHYGYNSTGTQNSTTYTLANGSSTITDAITQFDAHGNPLLQTQTTNNQTFTESYAYTPDNQLQRASQSQIAPNANVNYTYTPVSNPSTMQLQSGPATLASAASPTPAPTNPNASPASATPPPRPPPPKPSPSATTRHRRHQHRHHLRLRRRRHHHHRTYYDDTGLLHTLTITAGSVTTYQATLTYTSSGQRDTETITRITGYNTDGTAITSTQTLKYIYDNTNEAQLTAVEDITNPAAPQTLESFALDSLGNRTSTGYAPTP